MTQTISAPVDLLEALANSLGTSVEEAVAAYRAEQDDIGTATTAHTDGTVSTAAAQVSKGDIVRVGRRDMVVSANRPAQGGRLRSLTMKDARGTLTLWYEPTSGISVVVV